MALNTGKCNYLTELHFNPFTADPVKALHFAILLSPERQSARMSKIINGGLDQYGKV